MSTILLNCDGSVASIEIDKAVREEIVNESCRSPTTCQRVAQAYDR